MAFFDMALKIEDEPGAHYRYDCAHPPGLRTAVGSGLLSVEKMDATTYAKNHAALEDLLNTRKTILNKIMARTTM